MKDGHPAEFSQVVIDMKNGKTGHLRIEDARKGRGKVSGHWPVLYYNRQSISAAFSWKACGSTECLNYNGVLNFSQN